MAKPRIQKELEIVVNSGPVGALRRAPGDAPGEGWPCIEYRLDVVHKGRVVLADQEYSLGVGYVDWKKVPGRAERVTHQIAAIMGRGRTPADKQLWANAAGELAKLQKVKPKADDVVYCLLTDSRAYDDGLSFSEWAGDYGFSDDSIIAKENYDACMEIGRALTNALGHEKLAELREAFEDY
jgi:hypothetical protein